MSDAAHDCQAHKQNRGEVGERRVADRSQPECQHYPAQRRNCRAQRECEQLRLGHVDAERRSGPLVGSNGEQSPPAAPTTDVRHHPHRQQRHCQHEEAVSLRVTNGADVEAEQLRTADLSALHAAGVFAVAEQHQLYGGAESQRDNCQVDAAGSYSRQGEDESQRHGGQHAGDQRQQERDVEHRNEAT